MLLGVDVGGTFTDAALLDGERLHTAKVPTTAGGPVPRGGRRDRGRARRAGANSGDLEAFTHGMTVGTNALLEERGARTALIATRGLRRPARDRPPEPPSLYHPCRGAAPSRWSSPACGSRPPSASAPTACVDALPERRGRAPGGAVRRGRSRVGGRLPAVRLQRPLARAPHRRGRARGAARRPRLRLARGAAGLPRVRALLDDRDRRLPLPPARPLPRARSPTPARARHPRAAGDALLGRHRDGAEAARVGRLERALGARGRRGRRGRPRPRRGRRRRRARARHGRHLLRRLRGRRRRGAAHRLARDRRPPDPAADGGRPHRRGRRRLDRLAGPGRRAARRPALGGRRAGPRLLRARRHRADGHRRQPAARLPGPRLGAGRRRRAGRRGGRAARSPPSARELGLGERSRPPRGSPGSPTRRWCARCG